MGATRKAALTVYTVGHSNRAFEDFVGLLQALSVARVVDVRRIPRSAHNPQFDGDTLAESLRARGVDYAQIEALGGLRKARKDSRNAGWRNASFRGYADYMETHEFEAALDELVTLARERTTAIMCAEAVPWRCHRQLIADALVARMFHVEHILGPGSVREHSLPDFARVLEGRVTYPGETTLFDE